MPGSLFPHPVLPVPHLLQPGLWLLSLTELTDALWNSTLSSVGLPLVPGWTLSPLGLGTG